MKEKNIDMFSRKELPSIEKLKKMLTKPLKSTNEFADIYIENTIAKSYGLSEGIISDISSVSALGAGIRVVKGDHTGYSFTEDLSERNIIQCINDASSIAGSPPSFYFSGKKGRNDLYNINSSLDEESDKKIDLLRRAEKKAFAASPYVEKVEVNLIESRKIILIINSLSVDVYDDQPLLRFSVSTVLNKGNKRERGSQGGGGRTNLSYFHKRTPEMIAAEAVSQALILFEARPAPVGEMEVALGAGESGILLHESIGHPLEADFNYRGSSAFTGMIGKIVASEQCTIIDRGNLPYLRGSVNIDDEGNESGKTVLIENGILKTYMFDLKTANYFKCISRNGRRQSFRHIPLPRMTNTYMAAGKYSHEEIVKSIKKGVYAKSFSGGQVDICSGDFVFSITEGYWIEKGKIDFPIKGATLIGNGPKILKDIIMVGNDLVFSDGKWTCGKEGQSVPVGVGMPTAKLSHITVGGTKNV
jgi:TldD protein